MLGRIVNALLGCLGAAAAGQIPAFQAQYKQQLAGRLEQVREDLGQLFAQSRREGMSPEEFLQRAEAEAGPYTRTLIEDARGALETHQRLQEAYSALSQSDPLNRPFIFLRHLEPNIAESVAAHFQPAMPLSLEGLIYAGLGLLIGVAFAALLEYVGGAVFRSFRLTKRKEQDGEQRRSLPRR